MRIVVWTDSYTPEIGGLEVFCLRLLAGLRARGHECLVVTNAEVELAPRQEIVDGIEVHRYAFHQTLKRSDLAGFRQVTQECDRTIAAFQPELIHLNVCSRGLLSFAFLQRRKRWPAVTTLHDRHLYRNTSILSDEVFSYSDAVVGVSEFIGRDGLAHMPGLRGKLRVILNALPDPDLAPAPFPSEPRFLAMGRLVWEKGFDTAIEAFSRICSEYPTARLTLAGGGEAQPKLERLVAAKRLKDRVDFLGWQDPNEICALINRHSAVIVPSRWQEPFGLVALQAAQMGRPACVARTGGLPEIVREGETGLLFEPDQRG